MRLQAAHTGCPPVKMRLVRAKIPCRPKCGFALCLAVIVTEAMMGNYIYIVECADGTWYTGWTTDPDRRVHMHNTGKGAKYTRSRRPVRLIYTEEYETSVEAQRREYEIKHLTRAQKEAIVRGNKGISGKEMQT